MTSCWNINEPPRGKTNNFVSEQVRFGFRKKRNCTIRVAKTDADQLRGYREADLRFLFSPMQIVGFPMWRLKYANSMFIFSPLLEIDFKQGKRFCLLSADSLVVGVSTFVKPPRLVGYSQSIGAYRCRNR